MRPASRLVLRPQITTDANVSYKQAIEAAFGSDVDYAQLLKQYGTMPSEDGSPTARVQPEHGYVRGDAGCLRQPRS